MRIQVVRIPSEGDPVVLVGDPECTADPCAKHRRCHCMCPCMPDGGDNCQDCASSFGDDIE